MLNPDETVTLTPEDAELYDRGGRCREMVFYFYSHAAARASKRGRCNVRVQKPDGTLVDRFYFGISEPSTT